MCVSVFGWAVDGDCSRQDKRFCACLQGKEELGIQEAAVKHQGRQMLRGGWAESEARSGGAPSWI